MSPEAKKRKKKSGKGGSKTRTFWLAFIAAFVAAGGVTFFLTRGGSGDSQSELDAAREQQEAILDEMNDQPAPDETARPERPDRAGRPTRK